MTTARAATPPSSLLPSPFSSVLVANRGEIAVRICRTLREMGIRSVVTASIPDRKSLAVRSADDWVLLEGYSAAESYLDVEAVIAAAKAKGCEAIHPGYGFLSERADFAERCAAEGIVFIGPPPQVLRGLGDKSAARQLAVANGVPVVPGYDGPDDDATLVREAERIGAPLMVKARGGGGGRGMCEVYDLAGLPEALASARREAHSAFGDPGLLLEKLVTMAHHVEVQVLADAHGNLIHLGERDCSVQRRRQKLIEETPSPVVDEALRARLTGAALTLARAAGYVNAGTVEFLVGEPGADGERPFYFLEVNPRLQVEHPVTEMVTGLDLVELQLRVAAGESLPMTQEQVTFTGHAIELRVNAEDPWDDFRPSSGKIEFSWLEEERYSVGEPDQEARADIGYEDGDVVPSNYDSLLAKIVRWRMSRSEAIADAQIWGRDDLWGPRTNLGLLHAVVISEDFGRGAAHIGWLESALDELKAAAATLPSTWMAAGIAAAMAGDGWRGAGPASVWLDDGQVVREVQVHWDGPRRGRVQPTGDSERKFRLLNPDGGRRPMRLGIGEDVSNVAEIEDHFGVRVVQTRGGDIRIVPPPPLPRRAAATAVGATAITAPLPGAIATVVVAEGDVVDAGDEDGAPHHRHRRRDRQAHRRPGA
jgi:acetyl-CoA/propionyl-CoA carboxylase, biotin carboxylase, biotin carboxyl carrier protein